MRIERYSMMMRLMLGVMLTLSGKLVAEDSLATTSQPAGGVDVAVLLADVDEQPDEPTGRYVQRATGLIEKGGTELERAAGHMAMANHELSLVIARPASRWLLGVVTPADRQRIADAAARAQEHIEQARRLLPKSPAEGEPGRRQAQLGRWADMLEPFAAMFSHAAVATQPTEQRAMWSDFALDLAENRESDQVELAAASLMWQTFAWEQAGKSERAMVSLPNAWSKPRIMPWDMMSRLLRCRILADEGQYVAANTLLIRIRGMCEGWLQGQPVQTIVGWKKLTAVMQYVILNQWRTRWQNAQSKPADLAAIDEMLADLRQRELEADSIPPVYLLRHAIPLLVTLPEVAEDAGDAEKNAGESKASMPATLPANP